MKKRKISDKKYKGPTAMPVDGRRPGNMINWLIVLVLLLPVLFSRHTMDPALTPRYIFISCFTLVFILFFFVIRKLAHDFEFPTIVKAVFICLILYAGWCAISTFFAVNPSPAYYEINRHLLNTVLLFIVMVTILKEEGAVVKLCKALLIVSVIQSTVGILQYFEIAFADLPGSDPKPYGLMANRTLFGSAQVFLIPFIAYIFLRGSKFWKFLGVISLSALMISILISQTRSAWIATSTFGIVSTILILIYSRRNRKKWIFGMSIFAVAITSLLIIFIQVNPGSAIIRSMKAKVWDMIETQNNQSSSIYVRKIEWRQSLKMLRNHPAFGVGPGNWKLAIPGYGSNVFSWQDGLTLPNNPHNILIETATETGLPGAVLYVAVWIIIGFAGLQIVYKTKSEDCRIMCILMLSGLAAFAMDSMFSFPTQRMEHSLYACLMAGIILGSYTGNFQNSFHCQFIINKKLVVAGIIIAISNMVLAFSKYGFEKHSMLSKQYRMAGEYQRTIDEVEAGKSVLVTLDPNGEPLEMQSAAAFRELKDYENALKEIKRAKRYHPNSARILTTMGVIFSDLKQYDKAVESYIQALKISPHYVTAQTNLAGVYFLQSNYSMCIKTLDNPAIESTDYLSRLRMEATKRLNEKTQ